MQTEKKIPTIILIETEKKQQERYKENAGVCMITQWKIIFPFIASLFYHPQQHNRIERLPF